MLADLRKEYRVDDRRIFVTGHSNGGGFTYLLWANRGDQLAAVAPCAAASLSPIAQFKPKPVFHLAGEKDPIVKLEWQKMTMDSVRKINQCGESQPWGDPLHPLPVQDRRPVGGLHPSWWTRSAAGCAGADREVLQGAGLTLSADRRGRARALTRWVVHGSQ